MKAMNENRNIPIELIRELQTNLDQVAQQIEQSQEENNLELLHNCKGLLHQVQGSLQILNLMGIVVLVQEMEELLSALVENRVLEQASGLDLLSSGVLFIPRYLEYVQTQQKEVSVLLLPTINAIRRVRKVGILPEHVFVAFPCQTASTPQLSLPGNFAQVTVADGSFSSKIPRIRHLYQVGLIGVIRNSAVPIHLKNMQRAMERLLEGTANRPFAESWVLGSAILDALSDQGLHLDNSVKQVLGLVDRQIRKLQDSGLNILDTSMDEDVRTAMLYYLAKSVSAQSTVQHLRQAYQLADLVPDEKYLDQERKILDAPDRSVMAKVAGEIQKSLDYIKDRIDFLTGEGNLEDGIYQEVLGHLQQMTVTLQVLDLKQASQVIQEVSATFQEVYETFRQACKAAGSTVSIYELEDHSIREKVIDIAGALLGVEASVQGYAQGERRERKMSALGAAYADARKTALKEACINMDLLKQAVGAFIDPYSERRFDVAVLQDVPTMIQNLKGVLHILQKDRAVRILVVLGKYLQDYLMQGKPELVEAKQDVLADAVSSFEFYLEALEQYQQADEGLLDVTNEALQELGCERA